LDAYTQCGPTEKIAFRDSLLGLLIATPQRIFGYFTNALLMGKWFTLIGKQRIPVASDISMMLFASFSAPQEKKYFMHTNQLLP
jgi:hypothetical protein